MIEDIKTIYEIRLPKLLSKLLGYGLFDSDNMFGQNYFIRNFNYMTYRCVYHCYNLFRFIYETWKDVKEKIGENCFEKFWTGLQTDVYFEFDAVLYSSKSIAYGEVLKDAEISLSDKYFIHFRKIYNIYKKSWNSDFNDMRNGSVHLKMNKNRDCYTCYMKTMTTSEQLRNKTFDDYIRNCDRKNCFAAGRGTITGNSGNALFDYTNNYLEISNDLGIDFLTKSIELFHAVEEFTNKTIALIVEMYSKECRKFDRSLKVSGWGGVGITYDNIINLE